MIVHKNHRCRNVQNTVYIIEPKNGLIGCIFRPFSCNFQNENSYRKSNSLCAPVAIILGLQAFDGWWEVDSGFKCILFTNIVYVRNSEWPIH